MTEAIDFIPSFHLSSHRLRQRGTAVNGYVVLVEFRVQAVGIEDFRSLVIANARASAQTEPGCRRFDVVSPTGRPDTILLYGIYDDRAAFDAHIASPHYARFDAASAGLVITKSVVVGELICEGSKQEA